MKLFELIDRLGLLLRSSDRRSAARHGLQPIHLQALRFLAQANRYSDTPVAVTEYLGLTKGTASQTLLLLRKKGLLSASPDADDGRKTHLQLTAAGRRVHKDTSPPAPLLAAAKGLGSTAELERDLEGLLRELQRDNDGRSFGICHTCRHFQTQGAGYQCGLTGEPLRRVEIDLLCREHEEPVSGS